MPPFKAKPEPSPLAGLLQDLLQEDKEVAGSLLTSSCRLQQFRHNPAGKGEEAMCQLRVGRVGIPGAALGHYLLMGESQKILDQHIGPYQVSR